MQNEPKFKVGDAVRHKASGKLAIVTHICQNKMCQIHNCGANIDDEKCVGFDYDDMSCEFNDTKIPMYNVSIDFDNVVSYVSEDMLTHDPYK